MKGASGRAADAPARLSTEEVKLFFKLLWTLLFYTNEKRRVIKGLKGPDLRGQDMGKVMELNDALFSHPELIESFASENPFGFAEEEIEIVRGWTRFIKGDFLVVAHAGGHSVLLATEGEPKAYGVVGLFSDIQDLVQPPLPRPIETTLLPFLGRVVYCGVIGQVNLIVGPSMARSMMVGYRKAVARFGLVTTLDSPVAEREGADEELLRYYLLDSRRRDEHEEDIEELVRKDPSLMNVRSLELGRSYARSAGKRLRQLGASPAWFAVLEDVILASGRTKGEAMEGAQAIVPPERLAGVHALRHAGR